MRLPKLIVGTPALVVAALALGMVLLGALLIFHGARKQDEDLLMEIVGVLGAALSASIVWAISHARRSDNGKDEKE